MLSSLWNENGEGEVMMYQFAHEEIKSCKGCPIRNDDFYELPNCNLTCEPIDEYDSKVPDWCPLEQIDIKGYKLGVD